MPETLRILITGAGTTTAVSVLKGLLAANDPSLRTVMGDMNPDCAGAHLGDEFITMPPARGPDFGARAKELCREHNIHLVIPVIDYEFLAWSKIADDLLKKGTRVVISGRSALLNCLEKDRTFQYFRFLGVPTIDTWRADEIEDPTALPYPVYLKPRCGRASLDNYRAVDPAEFRHVVGKVPDPIVQPFFKGTEVTIDTLSDLDGRFLAASPRIRLEVKSGQAYRSRTIHHPELVDQASRIVEGLPIIGAANIQCFLTEDGPRFFEINARFGAGTILSIQAGLNGPLALANLARGLPHPDLNPRPNLLMLRYWEEVFV